MKKDDCGNSGQIGSHGLCRLHIAIRGTVQGVGFRPFIYRLARELNLKGWVNNSPSGVTIEAEGPAATLESFLLRIGQEKPPHAFIQSLEPLFLDPCHYTGFEIRESERGGEKSALVLPDIGVCPDCLKDIADPGNRRYRYPFTNCTNCGPRFSIITSLPYDRANTTMDQFTMCEDCRQEYENPLDRRFHAQPNACPVCGPHLELWDRNGGKLCENQEAMEKAAEAIKSGQIVAVKGLGGFHLMADAADSQAILSLRKKKHREEKPFALMYPDLSLISRDCIVSVLEERLLASPEAPIVILKRRPDCDHNAPVSDVALGNPNLGVMLPYTPLHHLLLEAIGRPVIATSGNLSDEPICTDEFEAVKRLGHIADLFLVHNRPIFRPVDDSIARIVMGREMILRRARGYAPLPIHVKDSLPDILAVGAHLKNSVAVAIDRNIFVSQHIGDLETTEALHSFEKTVDSLKRLYEIEPKHLACDMHPAYLSTQFARRNGRPVHAVQHHYAHILAAMAENDISAPLLGVAWDGTGFGTDGTIWGGEFLKIDKAGFTRMARLRPFPLPGSEKAVKEPRRAAFGILYEMALRKLIEDDSLPTIRSFLSSERELMRGMLERSVNTPYTSSAGRLFDAAASLLGIRQIMSFEGQAAMELEFAAGDTQEEASYPFEMRQGQGENEIDWEPMILAIIDDTKNMVSAELRAARFHNTLTEMIIRTARLSNEKIIVLSGGCFQNKYLTEHTVHRLQQEGFRPYWHQRIPPNDGGIALGQIMAVSRILKKES